MALRLWKRGRYVATSSTPVSFLSGLPNRSSQLFVETLLIWAFTNFCWYPLLQKQVFTFSRCFWKFNANKALCIYICIYCTRGKPRTRVLLTQWSGLICFFAHTLRLFLWFRRSFPWCLMRTRVSFEHK